MKPSELSKACRAYVAVVACAGILVVGYSLAKLSSGQLGLQWFVLAGLTLLSGSFTVRIPSIPARLSVSETFVFAAAMLFGPEAAAVLVVLDSLVISLWQPQTSRRTLRVLFNMAAPAVAIWLAAQLFFILARTPPLYNAPRPVLALLVPLLVMAVVYFLLNSGLIAVAVALEKRLSALLVWRQNFLWLSLNFFSGASVAALLLPYLQDAEQSFFRVSGILLPLLLISYLTFKTALGRVEDANKHLNELNQLYLSTIETLAMAIDAKDQITHGHIRRVQEYAVGLAHRMGIADPNQIRAIEAASLLHDMGKLAVPEYILNKPGKLTPAEFDRMKLHASVGADILSAINFPYPVVPIVRHHHENWDGTGYPSGLKGSAIPIGARILSVVDCFDALTSDRPYRPRLSDSEAFRILMQRRGTMYDPVIVDTFISSYEEISESNATQETQFIEPLSRLAIDETRPIAPHALENITASTEETLFLYDLARALNGVRVEYATETFFRHVRRLIPISACVLYEYSSTTDVLTGTYAAGENAHSFLGVTIPRGQRLTGWVAANKQTILNSDPVLDLGEVARTLKPRLRSCLSTPVLCEDRLLGVLTAYSIHDEPFGEDHRRVFESASRQLAGILESAAADDARNGGLVTGGADLLSRDEHDLRRVLDGLAKRGSVSLVSVEMATDQSGLTLVEAQLRIVAETIRPHLPNPDLIFRYGQTAIVATLPAVDHMLASQIALQIAQSLIVSIASRRWTHLGGINLGTAAAPEDGETLEDLMAMAKHRQGPVATLWRGGSSVH